MNTPQINRKLQKYKNFLGTYPCDKIPNDLTDVCGLVVNTDNSNSPGEHWVAIFIDKNYGEYFDSFGLPPLIPEIITFLDKHCISWKYNSIQFQGTQHNTCGQFAVLYLLFRLNKLDLNNFSEFLTHDFNVNNLIVKSLIKHL